MHPLSVFPQLLTFGLIAPLLLRLVAGVLFLWFGVKKYKDGQVVYAVIKILTGIFLVIGLYTQIASIIGIVLVSIEYHKQKKLGSLTKERTIISILVKVILLSLLFTGPGFLAFDLPL